MFVEELFNLALATKFVLFLLHLEVAFAFRAHAHVARFVDFGSAAIDSHIN